MSISIGTSKIISLFAEALVFGVHSALFFRAMGILLYKVQWHTTGLSRPRTFLLAPCTLLFLMAAMHLAVALREMIAAFGGGGDAPRGAAYFANFHTAANVVQNFTFVTSSIVADSVLTYRLYLAWGHNRAVIVLPMLLVVAEGVTGYIGSCVLALPSESDVGFPTITPWVKAAYSSSLCMNVLATALIVGRIWWASYQLRLRGHLHVTGTSYREFTEAIIQSGMLSAAGLACLLAAFTAGSNAWYICFDVLPPLIGVNFTLIIVRLGLGRKTAAERLTSVVAARGRATELKTARDEIPVAFGGSDKTLGMELSEVTESGSSGALGSSKNLSIIGDV